MNLTGLVVAVAIEVDRALKRVELARCGSTYVINRLDNHKTYDIPIFCTLIRGHSCEEHSNGMNQWR